MLLLAVAVGVAVGLAVGHVYGTRLSVGARRYRNYVDLAALADDILKTPDATDLRDRAHTARTAFETLNRKDT